MFLKDLDPLIDKLNDEPFEDFTMSIRGYALSADYDYSGYLPTEGLGMLWPDDDAAERHYSMVFTLRTQEKLAD